MKTKSYDRGSVVVIEVEFKKYTPFGDYAYFNPDTSAKITVTDPDDAKKIDDQTLVQAATGKYYYKVQTAASWIIGDYVSQVNCEHASDTDITIEPKSFHLK